MNEEDINIVTIFLYGYKVVCDSWKDTKNFLDHWNLYEKKLQIEFASASCLCENCKDTKDEPNRK